MHSFLEFEIVFKIFLDPKNIPLDIEIIDLCAIQTEIWPFGEKSSIFGGHLEYFKMLKGAAPALIGILIWKVSRHENH